MRNQVAINSGNTPGMTIERQVNNMLENGFNVFIARWKKVYPFQTSSFGYEVMEFVQRTMRGSLDVSFVPVIKRGEVLFWPDEMDVPVAYIADTPYNRSLLASCIYVAQFTINGMITPTGTINKEAVNAQLIKQATEMGIKAPVKMRMVGVYGNALPVGTDLSKINKDILGPQTPDASKSVFGSKEKMNEVVESAKAPEAVKVKEEMKAAEPLTQDECIASGERHVIERFLPLVEKLQKEKKKYWKSSQYYRDIIAPEIKKETARLLLENGHPLETVVTPTDAPDAPEVPAVTEEKEAVPA